MRQLLSHTVFNYRQAYAPSENSARWHLRCHAILVHFVAVRRNFSLFGSGKLAHFDIKRQVTFRLLHLVRAKSYVTRGVLLLQLVALAAGKAILRRIRLGGFYELTLAAAGRYEKQQHYEGSLMQGGFHGIR